MALTDWQEETLYRGAPDPNSPSKQYHPLVEYLNALEARVAAAEANITSLDDRVTALEP